MSRRNFHWDAQRGSTAALVRKVSRNHIWKMLVLLCGLWVRVFSLYFLHAHTPPPSPKELSGNLGCNFPRGKVGWCSQSKASVGLWVLAEMLSVKLRSCTKYFRKSNRTKDVLKHVVGSIAVILLMKFAHFLPPLAFHDGVINPSIPAETSDGKGGMEMAYLCAEAVLFLILPEKYFSGVLFN